MAELRKTLTRFIADQHGATAIEYSIIAARIASAIAATIALTGTSIQTLWTSVRDAL